VLAARIERWEGDDRIFLDAYVKEMDSSFA